MRHGLVYFALLAPQLMPAGDGRPPRASASDYPVHQDTENAVIGAVRVPADQLNKIFPPDLAKKYVVIEVAVYPNDGANVDVNVMEFSLKLGADGEAHPSTPDDVAWMWRPHNTNSPEIARNTHVTAETGVMVGSAENPNTGRKQTSVGTYEGVGVSNYPTQNAPPPSTNPNIDADRMEAKLASSELPGGKTTSPVAGYLYFPLPSKKTKGGLELQYKSFSMALKPLR